MKRALRLQPKARAPFTPSRRLVLRGLLGGLAVSVALPPLLSLGSRRARAADDGFPLRFGLFTWGNGNLPDRWVPTQEGEGDAWSLSEQLAGLALVKPDLTVITGLSCKVPNIVPHGSGNAGMLSGLALDQTTGEDTFAGPSIDQIIAAEIGQDTLYQSILTAASNVNGSSYNGPFSRNPPDTDPYTLYERLFGATFREPGEEGLVDPTLGLRRSALDAVMGDIATLNARVGSEDKLRLEQHLDGVRQLETRLARLEEDPPSLESCARPATPEVSYPDLEGRPQVSARNRVMADMLAMALACDQTRVFGHTISDPVSDLLFDGASAGHHDLTHNEGGDQPEVHNITLQIIDQLAVLIEALRAVPEGDATLLDHCVVMAVSEVSLGRTHSLDDMPILLAGSCGGALKTDLHLRSTGQESTNRAHLSVMRALGIPALSFGEDDGYTEDGLSGLEV
ncbi:MAG: DUF1552 domain-containing protein [Deltaproteobacteria bacterium]|nr:DUF1552 domain-containing protein [Deltaproteobacteria bacterium]